MARGLGGLLVAAVLVVAALLTIDTWYPYVAGRPSRPVPVATAEKVLQRSIDLAMDKNMEGLCDQGASRLVCEEQLRSSGPVPPEAPRIVSREVLLPTGDNGGGTILVVEGTRAGGAGFRTDFLVSDTGRHGFRPQNPVWWSGVTYPAEPGTRAVFRQP